ncbi:helix-turn-helix domain-containing protein [Crocinitomix sp.]|nr:helix-turn-helix domain-containing protein [Crocinitomix sp.]
MIQRQIGNNIKRLRVEKKISQEKLAELSDLDRTYIQSIEKGERNISVEVLLKLSVALRVEVTEILKDLI